VNPLADPVPKLSVVATSRNDGHGGDLIERMQWFVDGLAYQSEEHNVDVELILVEWNPPPTRPALADVLAWPAPGARLRTRIVTVPGSIHARFKGGDKFPLFQMIAKNVGIRRAVGDNVLATNIDILFSDRLFRTMTGPVQRGVLYRADRHDVDFPLHSAMTVPEALLFCAAHPLRYMRRDGAYYPGRGRVMPNYKGLADFAGFQGRRLARRLATGNAATESARSGRLGRPASWNGHDLALWTRDKIDAVISLERLPHLHTNACGDFTLLARQDWEELRGYPEWPMFSWNLDSILLYQAAAAGMTEVDLDEARPLYHMEHDRGSGWTPEGRGDLFGRLDRGGVEYLTDRGLRLEALKVRRAVARGGAAVLNPRSWGLEDAQLPDTLVSGPRVDRAGA